jgi:Domain of unknown function (DUF4411)
MTYLVDANVLIQAKNAHYAFDFCPGFWEWLLAANEDGTVFSVQKVAEELRDGNDELAQWTRDRDDAFFLVPDDPVVTSLQAAHGQRERLNTTRALPPPSCKGLTTTSSATLMPTGIPS